MESVAAEASAAPSDPKQLVYRTRWSSKYYHRVDCLRVRGTGIALPLQNAVRHFRACGLCDPAK